MPNKRQRHPSSDDETPGEDRGRPLMADLIGLDRALLWVEEAAFAELQARFDRPAALNERLRKSMQAPVPWERE